MWFGDVLKELIESIIGLFPENKQKYVKLLFWGIIIIALLFGGERVVSKLRHSETPQLQQTNTNGTNIQAQNVTICKSSD
jgi:hypothetical protein